MANHFSTSQIDTVLRRLEEIERRVRSVEALLVASSTPAADTGLSSEPAGRPARVRTRRDLSPVVVASLTGRTSLVLGGGYLLRALTDFDILPLLLGVVLGLAYATSWFIMADRAGASRKTMSATFHGFAATVLAFPLLFEVIVKFKLLDAWNVATGLTAVAALGIAVAWRRWLQGVVWIVSAASIITVLALLRAGADIAPFALHLVLLAVMTYWVAHARDWWRVRWPSAIFADGAVVWLAMHTLAPQNPLRLTLALAVAMALFVASLGSFSVRILLLGQKVIGFELFQSAAALLVGYGGAVYMAHASNLSAIPYGATGLLLGVCAYAVALMRLAMIPPRTNFVYFSTMAIALVIAGGSVEFRPPVAAALWIALALAGISFGRRFSYTTLSAHGAAYLAAAAIASGLVVEAGEGLVGHASWPWRELTPVALITLAAAAACSAVSSSSVRTFKGTKVVTAIVPHRAYVGIPRAIALAILVLGLSGIAVVWVVPVVAGPPRAASDWGIVATIRTTVLAAAVVLMALLARSDRIREAGWLIYPLLIAAGLKILLEDFRQSEPATLFVALIAYGCALIVGPRLALR